MICEKKRQLKCSGWVALVESVVSRCCTLRPVDEILKSAHLNEMARQCTVTCCQVL